MERDVANIRVRTVGTLGGNLAFADPHSDPATFLLASDASRRAGARRGASDACRVGDFVEGPYATALEPGRAAGARSTCRPCPRAPRMAHLRFAFHERPAVTVSCLVEVATGASAGAGRGRIGRCVRRPGPGRGGAAGRTGGRRPRSSSARRGRAVAADAARRRRTPTARRTTRPTWWGCWWAGPSGRRSLTPDVAAPRPPDRRREDSHAGPGT